MVEDDGERVREDYHILEQAKKKRSIVGDCITNHNFSKFSCHIDKVQVFKMTVFVKLWSGPERDRDQWLLHSSEKTSVLILEALIKQLLET